MELDFDKEIDALLRRMPKSDADISAGNPLFSAHPDADEISAFAENALPEKAKQRLTAHLADCDACRKNLSELILLNSENEAVTVAEPEETPVIAPAAVSWYQKLFAFPNLAYAMGALVLAFTGLTAFIVLQNLSGGGLSSDVASSNTSAREKAVAPASQNAPTMANANSAASSNTAVGSDSAQNTAIISPQSSPEIPAQNLPAENPAVDKKMPFPESKPEDFSRDEDDLTLTRSGATPVPTAGANLEQAERENQARSEISTDAVTSAQAQPAPKAVSAAPPPPPASGAKLEEKKESPSKRRSRELSKSDMKDKNAAKGSGAGESRQIGAKTFTQRNGVWYDSAYRNQPTLNVRRGTNEYQRLDSGLRAVGNQLGGVVVVVWDAKAYRIQ